MGLEAATYPSQLVLTNPTAGDPKSQGDDHLRLIKTVIQSTFPNVSGSIGASNNDINAIISASTTGAAAFKVATQPATDSSNLAASTEYVSSAILASSGITAVLPAQSGNAGYSLTTNGSVASWGISFGEAMGIYSFINS